MPSAALIVIDRTHAARLGRETLSILRAGGYRAPSGRWVSLDDLLNRSREATVEYPPDRMPSAPAPGGLETGITLENATVLEVGRRMAAGGSVAALNFASATMPGGGFLAGARAQEESIARSSGLFHALEGRAMYDYHRARTDDLYSDYVIYTPDVPVFRLDGGELLEEPWALSILTSPAVNGGALHDYAPERLIEVPAVMRARTTKVLAVAAEHGVRRLILGAWGCGAFGLEPDMMARTFHESLTGPFRGVFDEIAFAITDWSADHFFIGPFRRAFGG